MAEMMVVDTLVVVVVVVERELGTGTEDYYAPVAAVLVLVVLTPAGCTLSCCPPELHSRPVPPVPTCQVSM